MVDLVSRLALGLSPGLATTQIVLNVPCQVGLQISSKTFHQADTSVLSAKTFPGDVDLAQQAHRPRPEDNLHHHGRAARTPNLEIARA